jgi:Chromo (CHRromatin Organisation MOdifier) domain
MPYIKTKEHRPNYMRPPPDMIKGEEQYEVEVIQAHQYHRCKLQYLIKWKGYPVSDNTWEPADNLQAPLLVKEYHEAHLREDKRVKQKARVATSLPHLPHSVWLVKNNHLSTFTDVKTAAATLAAAAPSPTALTVGLSIPG